MSILNSPNIIDRAQEINELLTGEYDPEADDLFNRARRFNLFATNFQDPYYLDSILNQNAANKAAMDVFKQGFRNQNMMNQGIMNQAPSMFLDDAGLPAIDTSFGVANEPDVEEDVEKAKRSRTGIGSLFNFLQNIPTPLNLLRKGLESLSGFNQRIRNTDFGRSSRPVITVAPVVVNPEKDSNNASGIDNPMPPTWAKGIDPNEPRVT